MREMGPRYIFLGGGGSKKVPRPINIYPKFVNSTLQYHFYEFPTVGGGKKFVGVILY